MDLKRIALSLATELTEHQGKLRGSAADVARIEESLRTSAAELAQRRQDLGADAKATTEHWRGPTAEAVTHRGERLSRNIDVTAEHCQRAARIVGEVTETVSTGQLTTRRLADEYGTRGERLLDQGMRAGGTGANTALMRAIVELTDRLIPRYTKESATELRRVDDELKQAATRLRALTQHVEHDRVAEKNGDKIHIPIPGRTHESPKHHGKNDGKNDGKQHGGKHVQSILDKARKHVGYHERGENINKFGPDLPWCSSFVTSVWRDAGVNIGLLPATEDVYFWGKEHDQAYGKHNLDEVRPGDALLFGSGPTPAGSTHIGIVESVHGNEVVLIEGNSDDRVQRVTHELSPATFYGGVHP